MTAKVDLHVHSKHSNRPSEWILRQVKAPESFTEPREIYRLCRERGMDFVTVSDHDTVAGALEIAHLPGVFLSCEVTAEFPEDGCEIHCLAIGISEEQHREIERLRNNVYELRDYLAAAGIVHSVAHPLFRVNDLLTLAHVEKLLVLFNRFEGINGIHDRRQNLLVRRLFGALTPAVLADLAERHRLAPLGPHPWLKSFTGGSDDHGGHYIATTWTETPAAATVAEYLAHLADGGGAPGGQMGSSLRLGQSLLSIGYEFYRRQFPFLLGNRKDPFAELFRALALGEPEPERAFAFPWSGKREAGGPPALDRATFGVANRVAREKVRRLVEDLAHNLRRGRLSESLAAAAGHVAPLALCLTPYLVALQAQHKDADLLDQVARRLSGQPPEAGARAKKAWFTDTLTDVNGVAQTIRTLSHLARESGRSLTAITCATLAAAPADDPSVRRFEPWDEFPLPGYESQKVTLPPVAEILDHCEAERYSEILVSTPGPLGLLGRLAGKMLGIPVTGIYHTDFPAYVRHLSGSPALEEATWGYMRWFFGGMERIYVASDFYRQALAERGFPASRLELLPRGVDARFFHPRRRDPRFWERFGLNGEYKFLYVGRISKEKNLDLLMAAFAGFLSTGRRAQLVVVGDGPELKGLARQRRRPEILFTGFLHGEELAQAYAGADAFVFPSTTDTFGNVVLEAQASGLPTIVTDQGGPQEIVRQGGSGPIVAADPVAFQQAMVRLYDDREEAAERALSGLRYARGKSWGRILEQLFDGGGETPAPLPFAGLVEAPRAGAARPTTMFE